MKKNEVLWKLSLTSKTNMLRRAEILTHNIETQEKNNIAHGRIGKTADS
jgi:hypothetical protein